jgi:hypothetical protein
MCVVRQATILESQGKQSMENGWEWRVGTRKFTIAFLPNYLFAHNLAKLPSPGGQQQLPAA